MTDGLRSGAWSAVFLAAWVGTGVLRDIRLAMLCGAVVLVLGVAGLRAIYQRSLAVLAVSL